MVLTLFSCEEADMQIVDGDTVLSFMADVDKAIDDAGTGQYRAFKLMSGLKAMGIVLKREQVVGGIFIPPAQPPEPVSGMTGPAVERTIE